jgi:hypothetical protein
LDFCSENTPSGNPDLNLVICYPEPEKDHLTEAGLAEVKAEAARLTRLIINHARLDQLRKFSVPFSYNYFNY